MSPIQVAEPPASIADALPVLNSASDRFRRLEPILAGQLEAEGRELIRMVAEHILTCLRSHDPAISLAPVVDVQWRRRRPLLEKACGKSSTSSLLTSSGSLQIPELDIVLLFFVLCKNIVHVETLIEENFNLAVCQLFWFVVCSTPAPWPPGR